MVRIAFIGAGSIVPTHMRALDVTGRAQIVAVCSRTEDHARACAEGRQIAIFTNAVEMLRQTAPDAVYVCLPPYLALPACQLLANAGIPFLVEKPVAALDSGLACEVAREIQQRGLVAAVGYHLRGLDFLGELRMRIRDRRPDLVIGRWLGGTPKSEWWGRAEMSGGQVIEQATHLYDLARFLLGDATVVAAASTEPHDAQTGIATSTSAILRFESGVTGAFINARIAKETVVELDLVPIATIRLDAERSEWSVVFPPAEPIGPRRSPFVGQAEAFLDAVENHDPGAVLASYDDGLASYQLTRAIVAAAGIA